MRPTGVCGVEAKATGRKTASLPPLLSLGEKSKREKVEKKEEKKEEDEDDDDEEEEEEEEQKHKGCGGREIYQMQHHQHDADRCWSAQA